METTTGKERQRQPQRLGTAAARTLAGLCLGLGMYGVIHGLKAEEGTLRLTLSAITLCCCSAPDTPPPGTKKRM